MASVNRVGLFVMGAVLSGLVGLSGCTDETKTGTGTGSPAPAPAGAAPAAAVKIADTLFVDKAPENALDITKALESAKEGETIVVRARIGGSREPFVDGRASFTVGDMSLKPCNETPGDTCQAPWDFCCESRTGKIANIQIIDSDGMVLKTSVKGQHGLQPLSILVVEGKVGPRADKASLILNAQRIFVEKSTSVQPTNRVK